MHIQSCGTCITMRARVMTQPDQAVAALKRCNRKNSVWHCPVWFSISDKRKLCERCRATAKRCNQSGNGKARHKRHRGTPKYKATHKRHRDSEKGKASQKRAQTNEKGRATKKRYRESDKGVASAKRARNSEKGKATSKRLSKMLMFRMSTSLRLMMTGEHKCPVTFPKLGTFKNNADAHAHFESTFDPWMNWNNHGRRTRNMQPHTAWQIGHRIPKSWYRHDDVEEIRKCWSRANLMAQCAVENGDANCTNALTRDQWIVLKSIWPKQCSKMTDEEAWGWARDNVDNDTRKAERQASNMVSSEPQPAFDTDSDSGSEQDEGCDSDSDSGSDDWF